MQIFVDSAEQAAIDAALGSGYVYGVTTNPTLLRRAGVRAAQVPELVRYAIDRGAREMHVQTYADDVAGMLDEAEALHEIAPEHVVIKLPATPGGYSAAAQLTRRERRVTLTAVYTLRQALLAQSVGARYIAVYLGRMRDAGLDALAVVGQMQALLTAQAASVQILAASIRDPSEVEAIGALGVGAATIAPPVLAHLLDSPATERAAATFAADAAAIR